VKGDLTLEDTDVIVLVNAANEMLAHGGGVAGAIVRRGGKIIQEESNKVVASKGRTNTGDAVLTSAGSLKCKYVVHAVGPIYENGFKNEPQLLANCISNSLKIAQGINPPIASISFPAISSGIFGFPKDLCAQIFFDVILKQIDNNPQFPLTDIRLTNFDQPTVDIFLQEIQKVKKKFKNM